jgi:hypothetical protein
MFKKLSLVWVLLWCANVAAQDGFGIKLGGYVNVVAFYDTRESVTAREGHLYMFPKKLTLDPNGNDINSKSSFNILAIQTRLTGKISAPDAFGAKTSGIIEGEFFGNSNPDVNGFRLRHAFVRLDWAQTTLLIGQYWNPMFITESFPQQVGSNVGIPFQPFSRNPQIRVIRKLHQFSVTAAAVGQRDFASIGPAGQDPTYLMNSGLPELHLQVQLHAWKHIFGLGGQYKQLKPRMQTEMGFKASETVPGYGLMGYAKFDLKPIALQLEGIYGGNLSDVMMLGGFAAKSYDATTGVETYTPLRAMSLWSDITYHNGFEYGVFLGYSKNMGAGDDIILSRICARGSDVDFVYRVAPRVAVTSGKLKLALEGEYTAAAYGATMLNGKVNDAQTVNNMRILIGTFYYF